MTIVVDDADGDFGASDVDGCDQVVSFLLAASLTAFFLSFASLGTVSTEKMVALGRVELPTCGLGNRRSIHLSYRAGVISNIFS